MDYEPSEVLQQDSKPTRCTELPVARLAKGIFKNVVYPRDQKAGKKRERKTLTNTLLRSLSRFINVDHLNFNLH